MGRCTGEAVGLGGKPVTYGSNELWREDLSTAVD